LDDDPVLKRFYVTILHPAARAFEKIERRGILVDQHKFHVLRDDLKKAIKESTDKQMSLLPNRIRIKYMDRIDEQLAAGKNPMLPSIVKEFFFSPGGLNLKPQQITPANKQPSLTKGHLRQVAEGHPIAAQMVAEMTTGDVAAKTLSTFVDGFLKHLRPDGRLHPSYMLFHGGYADGSDEADESGTVTGRLSAKEPAFQCCAGSIRVLTETGWVTIKTIVGEGGRNTRVMTHTGAWRDVLDVYRNGVRPVPRVMLSSCYAINCKDDHPYPDIRRLHTNGEPESRAIGFRGAPCQTQ